MQRLISSDKDALLRFLNHDYANNLYFFSYLKALDNDNSGAAIYGVYHNTDIVFAGLVSPIHAFVSTRNKSLLPPFSYIVMEVTPARIIGPEEPTLELISYCTGYIPHHYAYMQLEPGLLPNRKIGCETRRAHFEDIPELVNLYMQGEFSENADTQVPRLVRSGTAYLTRQEDKIVAAALTLSETPKLALVGGVYTDPAFRRRNLAKVTTLALCRELSMRGLGIYLYYDINDPRTQNFYRQLGFHEVGKWVIAKKDEVSNL